jgi:hypothetical protein
MSSCKPKISAAKIEASAFANRKRVMNSRWGLCWGLRRGLRSGLMVIVSGTLAKPARGSSPVEVFALFAILSAKVSASLRRQNKASQ